MSATHRKEIFSRLTAATYKTWCAETMGRVFGWGPEAISKVSRITKAHPVAARHWYDEKHEMRASYLAQLLAESDEMLAEFLAAIGRQDLADAARRDAVLGEIKTLPKSLEGR